MNFNYTYASPSVYNLVGYTADEMMALKVDNLVDADTLNWFVENVCRRDGNRKAARPGLEKIAGSGIPASTQGRLESMGGEQDNFFKRSRQHNVRNNRHPSAILRT